MLTNDVVSFEQLGPGLQFFSDASLPLLSHIWAQLFIAALA